MNMKTIMQWLTDNWSAVFGIITLIVIAGLSVYRFFGMPTEKQKKKVKEWLVWACIDTEKSLQTGTGQLKLRKVYNMFCAVPAFTWVAKLISFDMFSEWVSDALIKAKEMLISNKSLAMYVYGDNAQEEVEKLRSQIGDAS